MTVSTTTNKIVYTANGATNAFSFPFAIEVNGSADIQVFLTISGVVTQLSQPSQFSVVINAAIAPSPTPVGGTVNLVSTPANGVLVTILRTMTLTQPTSLANQGTLYQPVLETVDDNQTMQLQQLNELLGRQITVSVSDPAPAALPPVAQRANLGAAFDSQGNMIAAAIPASGVISSAMAPVVNAATLAIARTALGLGAVAVEGIGGGLSDDGAGLLRVNLPISNVGTNQSPTKANYLTQYVTSLSIIFTLPRANTTFSGFGFWVYISASVAVTFAPNAADQIEATSGSGISIVINGPGWVFITTDAAASGNWRTQISCAPTQQVLTAGAGATYTTAAGAKRLHVRQVGGGGGGGGTGAGATAGGAGGDTTFGSIVAKGGGGGNGAGSPAGGVGGLGGTAGTGTGSITNRFTGDCGQGGIGALANASAGGKGGNSPFGGAGRGGIQGVAVATAAKANSGSGGGGAGGVASGSCGGGGAGEYVDSWMQSPPATVIFTIGTSGTLGAGADQTGAAGGTGQIIVDEYYG